MIIITKNKHGTNKYIEFVIGEIPDSLKLLIKDRIHGQFENNIKVIGNWSNNEFWVDKQNKEIIDFITFELDKVHTDIHLDFECLTWFPRDNNTHIRLYYWECD